MSAPRAGAASPLGDLIADTPIAMAWWKRACYLGLGTLCLVLGVVGWLVPVVTGIPFYVAAVAFLGASSRTARRAINWGDRKLPERLRRLLRTGRRATPPPPAGPARDSEGAHDDLRH